MRQFRALALSAVLFTSGLAFADVVTDWNLEAINAIRATSMNPPRASRVLAITHLAIYDAVNCVLKKHEPYLTFTTPPLETSADAAAAKAAHRVLTALIPSRQAQFDAAGLVDILQRGACGFDYAGKIVRQFAAAVLPGREHGQVILARSIHQDAEPRLGNARFLHRKPAFEEPPQPEVERQGGGLEEGGRGRL